MTIFSIFAVISFVLNIILFLKAVKDKKDFNEEVKHECDDVNTMQSKMNELSLILKDETKSNEQKLEEIAKINIYCGVYLSGVKEHIPHQKLYF